MIVVGVRVVEGDSRLSIQNIKKESYIPRWRIREVVSLSEFVVFWSSQSVVN